MLALTKDCSLLTIVLVEKDDFTVFMDMGESVQVWKKLGGQRCNSMLPFQNHNTNKSINLLLNMKTWEIEDDNEGRERNLIIFGI